MRIRTIKPEFWRSDDVQALGLDVRLLFIGLWCYVDDNGVGIDDERLIAADLFALADDPTTTREWIRDGLATLSRGSQIVRYTVGEKRLLFIAKWDKHQKIDHPAKPRYPRPEDAEPPVNTGEDATLAKASRDPRESVARPSRLEQGNRGTGEQVDLAPAHAVAASVDDPWAELDPKPTRKPRARDELFEALTSVCGIDASALTTSGRGVLNKACRQLREVQATPEDVRTRAARYRERFDRVPLTPAALAKHWASLASSPPSPSVTNAGWAALAAGGAR